MTTVYVQELQKLQEVMGRKHLKRKALRRLWKIDMEGTDVTCWGMLFEVQAAATGKADHRWRTAVCDRHSAAVRSEEADKRKRSRQFLYLIGERNFNADDNFVWL